jgi:hypothetical protein
MVSIELRSIFGRMLQDAHATLLWLPRCDGPFLLRRSARGEMCAGAARWLRNLFACVLARMESPGD